jgi:hypothetical protein
MQDSLSPAKGEANSPPGRLRMDALVIELKAGFLIMVVQ